MFQNQLSIQERRKANRFSFASVSNAFVVCPQLRYKCNDCGMYCSCGEVKPNGGLFSEGLGDVAFISGVTHTVIVGATVSTALTEVQINDLDSKLISMNYYYLFYEFSTLLFLSVPFQR